MSDVLLSRITKGICTRIIGSRRTDKFPDSYAFEFVNLIAVSEEQMLYRARGKIKNLNTEILDLLGIVARDVMRERL